jgi:hypothetical protein
MSDRVMESLDQRLDPRDLGETIDWTRLGARIRRAALLATTLHLGRLAGGDPDHGAAVETPRSCTGG